MSINITNIVNLLQAKLDAIDANTDPIEVEKLNKTASHINNNLGVLSFDELPYADSATLGQIIYHKHYNQYYFNAGDKGWDLIDLQP